MGTVRDLVSEYIKNNICLSHYFDPQSSFNIVISHISRLEERYEITTDKSIAEILKEIIKENKLNCLKSKNLPIDPLIEFKIYHALYNLMQATLASKTDLIKRNREISSRRRKTINYLEKALAVEFPLLKSEEREQLKNISNRLKEYDNKEINYDPLKELQYHKEKNYPSVLMGYFGDNISYEPRDKIIEELMCTPLEVNTGRRKDTFFQVLQVVIYEYLRKEKIPIQKAKKLTANIINEYVKKQRILGIPRLNSKSIDNALYLA